MSYASKQQIKTIAERIDSKLDEKVNTTAYNAKVTEYDAKIATLEQTTAEQTEQIADLEAENRQQAFQIADLKNIVYDTVVEDAEYTYDELDVAPIPTHVSDGTNYHKTFDGAETMLAEVQGKTVNAPLAREAVIKGSTRKWNQLIDHSTLTKITSKGITYEPLANGAIRCYGHAVEGADYVTYYTNPTETAKINHIYLQLVSRTDSSHVVDPQGIQGTTSTLISSVNTGYRPYRLLKALQDGTPIRVYVNVYDLTSDVDQTFFTSFIDLTDMLGAGNEPTTIATVEQFLTDNPQFNGYVPHTTGAIASAEITDYTLCGENLMNHAPSFSNTIVPFSNRSNFVKLLAGNTYTLSFDVKNANTWRLVVSAYKENGTVALYNNDFTCDVALATYSAGVIMESGNSTHKTFTFTVKNTTYMHFNYAYGDASSSTEFINVCLNKGSTAAPYSPFISQTVSIDAEASGLPAVQDEVYCVVDNGYLVTKQTARFAKLDLGTATGTRYNSTIFFFTVPANAKFVDQFTAVKGICNKYRFSFANDTGADIVGFGSVTSLKVVTSKEYASFSDFSADNQGTIVYYELATPVTTELSRVPLTIDFEQVKNVLVSNTNAGIADVATEVQTGVLKSSMVSGVQVNGANLWNEEWETGTINSSGANTASNTTIRSKNYTEVVGGVTYRFICSVGLVVFWYDENKNFILSSSGLNISRAAPQNAKYVRFRAYDPNYGGTYKNDIAIFLGADSHPYRPYKPPFNFSLPSPQELRSAGTAHDVIRFVQQTDGLWNVENVGNIIELDLGAINYNMSVMSRFSNSVLTSTYKAILTNGGAYESLDALGYTNHGYVNVDTMEDRTYSTREQGSLYIKDNRFTTVADFRAYMAGKKIYLPTSEPVTTTLMTGLTEQEVATLIELYGSVEIVGNTMKQYAKPNLKTIIQVSKAVES